GYLGDKTRLVEQAYGADTDNPLHRLDLDVTDFAVKILALAKSDPAAAEQQVDELPQEHIAMLLNRKDFHAWQRAPYLKDFAQAGGIKQIIGHLMASEKGDPNWPDRSGQSPGFAQVVAAIRHNPRGGVRARGLYGLALRHRGDGGG